jgi:subtilisin family serine protease
VWQRLFTAALTTITVLAGIAAPAHAEPAGQVLNADSPHAVPDRYIVTLKSRAGVADQARTLAGRFGGQVRHRYTAGPYGFSTTMPAAQARRLAADPAVAAVEQVQEITGQDVQLSPPSWGLDRIDQSSGELDNSFTYPSNPGQGVTVYVLDSGLNPNHTEFTGRVGTGTDIIDGDGNPADCHGHGTHVAGTAVGTRYGVAKKARVAAVRVLNCQNGGYTDDFIAGINWVRTHAQKPAVANYSIICRYECTSPATDSAVTALINSGVPFVAAAGNQGADACKYSPQALPATITVGKITKTNWADGNHGPCLDLYAPGYNIVSAAHDSNTGNRTMTGSSMSSPHVAGAAATYLGRNPSATPAQVRDALVGNATTGKVGGTLPAGTPNLQLNTKFLNTGLVLAGPGAQSTPAGLRTDVPLSATGGARPYTWTATGLPAGVTLTASTGLISGTPTTAGTSTVTGTVTDGTGRTSSTSFTWTVTPGGGCLTSQPIGDAAFESPGTAWTASAGVIGTWPENPARTGTRNAWFDGNAGISPDTLSQRVTLPACAGLTLSFWLRIATSTDSVLAGVYQQLTLTVGGTALGSWTNLDETDQDVASGYVRKTVDLTAYAGQTVDLQFTGTSDEYPWTDIAVDDVTVAAS